MSMGAAELVETGYVYKQQISDDSNSSSVEPISVGQTAKTTSSGYVIYEFREGFF